MCQVVAGTMFTACCWAAAWCDAVGFMCGGQITACALCCLSLSA